mmetsp:Transcript_78474/g.199601  ORF Transcript_78474/g.199601 Transcript_78474/m.199601 type:complete len:233 (+) Transcript_78474:337-1035(+)
MQLYEDLADVHTAVQPIHVSMPLAALAVDLEDVDDLPLVPELLHHLGDRRVGRGADPVDVVVDEVGGRFVRVVRPGRLVNGVDLTGVGDRSPDARLERIVAAAAHGVHDARLRSGSFGGDPQRIAHPFATIALRANAHLPGTREGWLIVILPVDLRVTGISWHLRRARATPRAPEIFLGPIATLACRLSLHAHLPDVRVAPHLPLLVALQKKTGGLRQGEIPTRESVLVNGA